MSHPATFRSDTAYWLTLLFAIGWGGYCLVYGALVAIGGMAMGHRTPTGGGRAAIGIAYLAFAAFGWAIWWLFGRTCVIVNDETVVIKNPIRRDVVHRNEIARVTKTSGGSWALLVTKSGERYVMFGLSYGRRPMAAFRRRLGLDDGTADRARP
jgi:hypothetical protein